MNRQETINALGELLPKMEGKDHEVIETAIKLLKPKSIAISQEQIELLDALKRKAEQSKRTLRDQKMALKLWKLVAPGMSEMGSEMLESIQREGVVAQKAYDLILELIAKVGEGK